MKHLLQMLIYFSIFNVFCLFLLLKLELSAIGIDSEEAFLSRVNKLMYRWDTTTQPGLQAAAWRYSKTNDFETADRLLIGSRHIQEPSGDMFWMFSVIGAFLYGKDKMQPETMAKVRSLWKTYSPNRGYTENHRVMYYASLYLAAEYWKNLPCSEWFNGRSSAENKADAKDAILRWVSTTTQKGQGEFDSPNYIAEYLIPMVLLAEFAQDAKMKQLGKMMMDYLLFDFAVDHLNGMLLGGNSRDFPDQTLQPKNTPAAQFAYLYFGVGEPVEGGGWTWLHCLSSYRLPSIILYGK